MDEHGGDDTRGGPPIEVDPTALSVAATTAGGGLGTPGLEPELLGGRPWSPAAAMEPLPPLAPPPARPGAAGTDASSVPVPRRGPGPRTTALSIGVLIVAALVILVLVLAVGR